VRARAGVRSDSRLAPPAIHQIAVRICHDSPEPSLEPLHWLSEVGRRSAPTKVRSRTLPTGSDIRHTALVVSPPDWFSKRASRRRGLRRPWRAKRSSWRRGATGPEREETEVSPLGPPRRCCLSESRLGDERVHRRFRARTIAAQWIDSSASFQPARGFGTLDAPTESRQTAASRTR
jgi:hypothetical protein